MCFVDRGSGPTQDFTVENIYGVLGIDFNGQEQVEQCLVHTLDLITDEQAKHHKETNCIDS